MDHIVEVSVRDEDECKGSVDIQQDSAENCCHDQLVSVLCHGHDDIREVWESVLKNVKDQNTYDDIQQLEGVEHG